MAVGVDVFQPAVGGRFVRGPIGTARRHIASELKTPRSFVYRIREQLTESGDLAKPKKGSVGDKSGTKSELCALCPLVPLR